MQSFGEPWCSCIDVEPQMYASGVVMKTSAGKLVQVDVCCATEIGQLWMAGVETNGCCCGHGLRGSYVGVWDESVELMVQLGYQNIVDPACCAPENHFRLRGVGIPVYQDNVYYRSWKFMGRS